MAVRQTNSTLNNFSERIIIQESAIQGSGVFATRDINAGEVICRFTGQRLSISETQRLFKAGDIRVTCDTFQVGERSYIRLDDLYNSINHSCAPNAGIKAVETLVALREIKHGDEITFDYSTTEWTPQDYTAYNPDQWPMTCDCRTPLCRKKIKCFPYLPKTLQEYYIENGIVPDFILRKLLQPWEKTRCFICERC